MPDVLRLLVLGAHPDDAEFHAGGLIARYCELGHTVKLVSVSNGGAGHHQLESDQLIQTRRAEAAAAGQVVGAEYVTWDNPDGALVANLDLRYQIIREIRKFQPDLVLTHRTNDYHPDHRAVGQAVQDASYMVTVPMVCPETSIVEREPVVAYMVDLFTKPCPLQPDVVWDATAYFDKLLQMLACHESQVFDFLPFNQGVAAEVPAADSGQRMLWLKQWTLRHMGPRGDRFREQLVAAHGEERANNAELIEAFEISEYAGTLDESRRDQLFPVV